MQRPVVLFWVLLALWAAAYATSLWQLLLTDATGDGLTRGLNRVSGFIGWQTVAAIIALMLWMAARSWAAGALRWLARIPGLLALGLVLLILGLIAWAHIMKPGQTPTPMVPPTATKPVDQ